MNQELNPLGYYFDHSLFGWAIKDSASRYVYGNKLACRYFNVSEDTLVGSLDTDLTPDIGEYYRHIRHDDRKIVTTGQMSLVLKTFEYGRHNRLRSFLVEKRPWPFREGVKGIICTYMEISNIYFSTFLKPSDRKPFVFTRPANIFTDKEWEVILLLFCGVKQYAMPEILGISPSALRNRLIRCYDKSGVISNAALQQYCCQRGWDNYIPPFFLSKGHVLIN